MTASWAFTVDRYLPWVWFEVESLKKLGFVTSSRRVSRPDSSSGGLFPSVPVTDAAPPGPGRPALPGSVTLLLDSLQSFFASWHDGLGGMLGLSPRSSASPGLFRLGPSGGGGRSQTTHSSLLSSRFTFRWLTLLLVSRSSS